jgi:hypothetical protein
MLDNALVAGFAWKAVVARVKRMLNVGRATVNSRWEAVPLAATRRARLDFCAMAMANA